MPTPYQLPDLPYDYAALEPHMSARILELHHDKHHAAYVKGLNDTLDKIAALPVAPNSAGEMSQPLQTVQLQRAIVLPVFAKQ